MAREITCTVVKVFSETKTRRGDTRLQIVRWNGYAPVIEKREYWYDDNDQEKTGKLKGLNAADFALIQESVAEITELLKHEEKTDESV